MHINFPAHIADVDIRDWQGVTPEDLLLKRGWVFDHSPAEAAGRALKYSRSGDTRSYDEIGFRMLAATPVSGASTLQTLPGMLMDQQVKERKQIDPKLAQIIDQQEKLRHRPLDLPDTVHLNYRVMGGRLIHFTFQPENNPAGAEVDWVFHLSTPPQVLYEIAEERDVPELLTQRNRLDIPGINWLPFLALVQAGRFKRMQDWPEELEQRTQSGRFYIFLSHRWLTPTQPDPEAVHARFAAWQIFSVVCEAVRVARLRGLRTPRRFSPVLGFEIGASGSELAEMVLVNVLRYALDDSSLQEAWQEIADVEEVIQDNGISAAGTGEGLTRLAELVDCHPWLKKLLERVFLWYDYSCMPQVPRTIEEEEQFHQGLGKLDTIQMISRSAVLLDDLADYAGRAWCTLEALVADNYTHAMDLLAGSPKAADWRGQTEFYFNTLLQDRPHLVWRAILDTEVFGIQSLPECMTRLNLRLTDPNDLPFIYAGLKRLPPPVKIHTDETELLTGVMPVPQVNQGQAILWTSRSGRKLRREGRKILGSLDWEKALSVQDSWNLQAGDDPAKLPPFIRLLAQRPPAPGEPPIDCHLAVIGGCEGEAILISSWVLKHRAELEAMLGVKFGTFSWLAADIAPVGHFIAASLRAEPIDAGLWTIVTLAVRQDHCLVTDILYQLLDEIGIPAVQLAIDKAEDNVTYYEPQPREERAGKEDHIFGVRVPPGGFPVHPNGLFRAHLLTHLFS